MTAILVRRLSIAGVLLALVMIGIGGAIGGCAAIRDWPRVDK